VKRSDSANRSFPKSKALCTNLKTDDELEQLEDVTYLTLRLAHAKDVERKEKEQESKLQLEEGYDGDSKQEGGCEPGDEDVVNTNRHFISALRRTNDQSYNTSTLTEFPKNYGMLFDNQEKRESTHGLEKINVVSSLKRSFPSGRAISSEIGLQNSGEVRCCTYEQSAEVPREEMIKQGLDDILSVIELINFDISLSVLSEICSPRRRRTWKDRGRRLDTNVVLEATNFKCTEPAWDLNAGRRSPRGTFISNKDETSNSGDTFNSKGVTARLNTAFNNPDILTAVMIPNEMITPSILADSNVDLSSNECVISNVGVASNVCEYCCISFPESLLYAIHMSFHRENSCYRNNRIGYNSGINEHCDVNNVEDAKDDGKFHCARCGERCVDRTDFFLHIIRVAHD